MWTCSKCGSNVGDQFTTCQSCGTGVDGTAAPPPPTADSLGVPPRPDAPLPLPPELRAVEPPPPSLQERLAQAARTGAIYGALYGAAFVFIYWILLVMILRERVTWDKGPATALGEGVVKAGALGAAIGAALAVLFRLVVPPKPPKGSSRP